MKIGVADRNIVAKIYCRCLSTFLILNLQLTTFTFFSSATVKADGPIPVAGKLLTRPSLGLGLGLE